MPGLWGKIEAKRSFVYRLRRMSQLALAAALAACLLSGILITPFTHREAQLAGTYVEMLAESQADDTTAAMGGVRLDLLDAQQQ